MKLYTIEDLTTLTRETLTTHTCAINHHNARLKLETFHLEIPSAYNPDDAKLRVTGMCKKHQYRLTTVCTL